MGRIFGKKYAGYAVEVAVYFLVIGILGYLAWQSMLKNIFELNPDMTGKGRCTVISFLIVAFVSYLFSRRREDLREKLTILPVFVVILLMLYVSSQSSLAMFFSSAVAVTPTFFLKIIASEESIAATLIGIAGWQCVPILVGIFISSIMSGVTINTGDDKKINVDDFNI